MPRRARALKIQQDHARFKRIVRGKIKKNLRRYMSSGDLIGRKGKDLVTIPVPQIDIPRFRYGQRNSGGVSQGDGQPGDSLGSGDQPGQGQEAGDQPGEHSLEMEVTLDELAQIMGEELELPRIEPKGKETIESVKEKYTGIRPTGPASLRHFKRTYRRALKRSIAAGTYDQTNPVVVPIRQDMRYRAWKVDTQPHSNAVIIYMMDVSGSMGDEQKEIVRIESFWIDTWLRHQYDGIESVYIIHDATAREVDRDTFFRTRESGGTMISSAYKVCRSIIEARYPSEDWNIYPFHFSDGDNWSVDDTEECLSILRDDILPNVNMFGYGQVESPYGSGQFIKDLRGSFDEDTNMVLSEIPNRDSIYESIRDFLGKGI
ncbi:MAG: DUF444 family protein [Myxococcales bacterium]|nr:DUF444 family protein [Myxococcales bacterium]